MAGLNYGTPRRLDSTPSAMLGTPSKTSTPRGVLGTPLSGSRSRGGRANEKQKGLKLFSTKVCEKVRQKQTTTYNEVADELVAEVAHERQELSGEPMYDQKNIRRRVYDALNVLMAIQIIAKEKKEIRWIGLPTNSASECQKMEEEQKTIKERIAKKKRDLQELLLQQVAFSNLVCRNRAQPNSTELAQQTSSVRLPFVLLKTEKSTVIECSISNDRTEYSFDFDQPFEIFSDADVLHMMRMSCGLADGTCKPDELEHVRQLVPRRFTKFIDDMYENGRQPVAEGDRGQLSLQSGEARKFPISVSWSQSFGGNSALSLARSPVTVVTHSVPPQPDSVSTDNGLPSTNAADPSLLIATDLVAAEQGISSQSSILSGEEESSPSEDLEDESDVDGNGTFFMNEPFEVIIKQEPT